MNRLKKSEYVKRCQRRKKEFAVQQYGGKCLKCGYDKFFGALEFHHIDSSTKEYEPHYVIYRWSFERAKKELDKCILVCSNCHKEIEFGEGWDSELRSKIKPWIKKICEQCNIQFETKDEHQKYCTLECSSIGQRKAERPSKEHLAKLIESTTWTHIGRMFGVSDNAVRKWARKYELI